MALKPSANPLENPLKQCVANEKTFREFPAKVGVPVSRIAKIIVYDYVYIYIYSYIVISLYDVI